MEHDIKITDGIAMPDQDGDGAPRQPRLGRFALVNVEEKLDQLVGSIRQIEEVFLPERDKK